MLMRRIHVTETDRQTSLLVDEARYEVCTGLSHHFVIKHTRRVSANCYSK